MAEVNRAAAPVSPGGKIGYDGAMNRLPLIALAALAAGAAGADPLFQRPEPKDGYAYPECYCTNRGERVEIGETSCLRIGGREFTARCGMSLNNPAWRDRTEGCAPTPLSRARPQSELSEPG